MFLHTTYELTVAPVSTRNAAPSIHTSAVQTYILVSANFSIGEQKPSGVIVLCKHTATNYW